MLIDFQIYFFLLIFLIIASTAGVLWKSKHKKGYNNVLENFNTSYLDRISRQSSGNIVQTQCELQLFELYNSQNSRVLTGCKIR
jgi:hypothetical protein